MLPNALPTPNSFVKHMYQRFPTICLNIDLTFSSKFDVLSLLNWKSKIQHHNITNIGDYVDDIEIELKDTTYTTKSASYLDLHLGIDSECRA